MFYSKDNSSVWEVDIKFVFIQGSKKQINPYEVEQKVTVLTLAYKSIVLDQ